MSRPPYRGLALGLRVVSALIVVEGVFMILADKPLVLRVFLHPPASEVSILLLASLKEMVAVAISQASVTPDASPTTTRPGMGRNASFKLSRNRT